MTLNQRFNLRGVCLERISLLCATLEITRGALLPGKIAIDVGKRCVGHPTDFPIALTQVRRW